MKKGRHFAQWRPSCPNFPEAITVPGNGPTEFEAARAWAAPHRGSLTVSICRMAAIALCATKRAFSAGPLQYNQEEWCLPCLAKESGGGVSRRLVARIVVARIAAAEREPVPLLWVAQWYVTAATLEADCCLSPQRGQSILYTALGLGCLESGTSEPSVLLTMACAPQRSHATTVTDIKASSRLMA